MANETDTSAAGRGEGGNTAAAVKSALSTTVGTPARKSNKNDPGTTLLRGGSRILKYYKPTEAELDRLGELSRDGSKAREMFGFCVGLVFNVLIGLVLASNLSAGQQGAAIAVGVMALLGAYKFWSDARAKEKDGTSALEELKADHDFTTI